MSGDPWRIEDVGGVRLARCAALEGVVGLAHAFSTRLGPDGLRFDLGPADPEAEHLERRRALLAAAGLRGAAWLGRQVHGARIATARPGAEALPEADAIFAVLEVGSALVPAVRTADCVALLFADRHGRAVGAVHAGWRGTAGGIAAVAAGAFAASGIAAGDLVVAMGPAIRACCYEVGDEVVEALRPHAGGEPVVRGRSAAGRPTVDLPAVNRAQLLAAGIPRESIHDAPWCTRCRLDLFFSARAEGSKSGRLMAVIGRAAVP
jgi:YfiH family protein